MTLNDRAGLKQRADSVLQQARYDPKKLILIQSGVTVGVTFVLAVISYLLNVRMDSLGGLAGLGSRGMLSTIQSVLQTASTILLPIWEIGYLHACITMAHGEEAGPQSLGEGFRRFGPVIRYMLIKMLIFSLIGSLLMYPAAMIFMLTPFADNLAEVLAPLISGGASMSEAAINEAAAAVSGAAMPMVVIFGIMLALVVIPITYRLRMTEYVLMDQPRMGALAAMGTSSRMMKRNCISMFKLDLSFWWYYLAQALLMIVAYGDLICNLLGISLPMSPTVSFFLCYFVSLGGQLLLFVAAKNKVMQTYTQAYLLLKQPPVESQYIPLQPAQM